MPGRRAIRTLTCMTSLHNDTVPAGHSGAARRRRMTRILLGGVAASVALFAQASAVAADDGVHDAEEIVTDAPESPEAPETEVSSPMPTEPAMQLAAATPSEPTAI